MRSAPTEEEFNARIAAYNKEQAATSHPTGKVNGKAQSPTHKRESRIKLVPFDEIKLGTEPRYLVKGVIPRDGLIVIWGPPKCGKSFWMFTVAMHVALGWQYRDRRVQQGPVVYCAFEGQTGSQARSEAFRQTFPIEIDGPVPFYLQPVTLDIVAQHQELIAAVRQQLGANSPVLVVLDTLNRSLRGSENDAKDMAAYIAAADAIREAFNCSVAIVHHCGIDGTRPRGSTALSGAVDAQLAVRREPQTQSLLKLNFRKTGLQATSSPAGSSLLTLEKTLTVKQFRPASSNRQTSPRLPRLVPSSRRTSRQCIRSCVMRGRAASPRMNGISGFATWESASNGRRTSMTPAAF
jgi:hypothetical protein